MSEGFDSEPGGKVAIAIGASSSISSATVKPLASRGVSVVVAAHRESELEELAVTIESDGGDALVVPADITVDDNIDALVEVTLDEHGRIGILVNNAGLMLFAYINEADCEALRATIDASLASLITLTHTVVPTMMEQGNGHIVNLSSVVGRSLQASSSHYNAAKAGVKMFSNSLRLDVAEAGTHISSVEPGAVGTELLDYIPDEGAQKNVEDYVGTMDALAPEDVARTITFAVTQPEHIDINEVPIHPFDQVQP